MWNVKRPGGPGRQHREERRIRQLLLVPHHGSHLGACDDQDVGHPPFGAQIILGGHEYVARQAKAAGIAFTNVGSAFTTVAAPGVGSDRRCLVAECGCRAAASGLPAVDLPCLCFGLDLDEQQRSGFGDAVYTTAVGRPR
ncbi:conserved hypothetical protein (plasmid) [Rhodococcus jostii RHA1]|uniref:Uncharacterized protein n=1 Tax=Rhodococcus jostii (strain RHA1) TaxID=101510 RepID=Q0RVI0_RHOJR|nr:conserved hypothetical protein [Rhodococcus jostii RHA1]